MMEGVSRNASIKIKKHTHYAIRRNTKKRNKRGKDIFSGGKTDPAGRRLRLNAFSKLRKGRAISDSGRIRAQDFAEKGVTGWQTSVIYS